MVFIVTPIVLTVILATLIYRHYQPDSFLRSFECPQEDIEKTNGCLGPKDCLYAHPNDCFSYIQCVFDPDKEAWAPLWLPCSGGLEWNDFDKVCDWPDKSSCRRGMRQKMRKFQRRTFERVKRPRYWLPHHVRRTNVPSTAGYGPKPVLATEGNTTSAFVVRGRSDPQATSIAGPASDVCIRSTHPTTLDSVFGPVPDLDEAPWYQSVDVHEPPAKWVPAVR